MTLVASSIPNLVSGVSQQPAPSRLRTSGSEMVNGWPTVVKGLLKRPPSEYVADLSINTMDTTEVAVHVIERSATEKYILMIADGDLKLFDTSGNEMTVTFPDGKGYLPSTNANTSMRFVTVADTTFCLNTTKTVSTSGLTDNRDDPSKIGSVFIKQSIPSVNYVIRVDGDNKADFTTDSNFTDGTAVEGTARIASDLRDAFAGSFNAKREGTTVTFDLTTSDILSVDDQGGNTTMTSYKDVIQAFEELPPVEAEGRLVMVAGDPDDADTGSYWLEYAAGVWTETVGYSSKRSLDGDSMPHILVKTGTDTFEFRENDWQNRLVGDSDSNPSPSFTGSKINGMFLFGGRLGFLSEENVILSEVGNLENFYRTTTVQILPADVIDVASATGRVSTLYHAAEFARELILFSDKQQFRLTSGTTLSAENVGIKSSTAFPCSLTVNPVSVGSSTYFISEGSSNTAARQLFVDEGRETVDGEDIAVQVPHYIPKNVVKLSASPTEECLAVLSTDESNAIYFYKWYTAKGKKIQSAWCKWVFDVEILGMQFSDSLLYLVYKTDGGDVRLDIIRVGSDLGDEYLLDHKFYHTDCSVFSVDEGSTSYDLPTDVDSDLVVVDKATGEQLEYTLDSPTRITLDVSTPEGFDLGWNYEFRYDFSTQYLREENADGESAIQDGRLQLLYFSIMYTDTSYFEAIVSDPVGNSKSYVFNGRVLADPLNVTDGVPKVTGEFKFPVFLENERALVTLTNDQPYRCGFSSVEWSANYRPKARRIK